jgi:transposase
VIHLTQQTQLFLAVKPIDFRRQIDGLVAHCKHQLQQNPRGGALFVFINRSRTMMRFLHHDGTGYWLATKRLSQGRYPTWPKSHEALSTMDAATLMKLIKTTVVQS